MSGGLGPTSGDIRLAEDDEQAEQQKMRAESDLNDRTARQPVPGRRPFMSFRQLNVLTAIIVLAASGMVSPIDIAFCILSTIYAFFLSKFIFPSTTAHPAPPVFGAKNTALALYVSAGAIVGLLFPLLYMLEGLAEGDRTGIKAAAPHFFLLSAQVFMEGITFSRGFSLPVRAFVPVCYNSRRLFSISDWLRAEFTHSATAAGRGSVWRGYAGRALAVANMGFWSFNLFGFLLPVYLPRVFKAYYGKAKT